MLRCLAIVLATIALAVCVAPARPGAPRSAPPAATGRASTSTACAASCTATAAPTSRPRPRPVYPAAFRLHWPCIHRRESTDWHRTTDWLGRPSRQHGGMQIDLGTWLAFAPASFPRDPAAATPAQQVFVAFRIWLANGRRFGGRQWPQTSRLCGVA